MIHRSAAPPPAISGNVDAPASPLGVRSTQSLVSIQAELWRRPGLLARELAWRWLFGIPALLLLGWCGLRIEARLEQQHLDLSGLSLAHAGAALVALQDAWQSAAPTALRLALWVAPLLAIGWAAASALGRAPVLRLITSQPRVRIAPLFLLQLLRILSLAASWTLWFALVRWAARGTLTNLSPGAEQNVVGFAAWLICLSLASFVVWALLSWILSFATILVAAEHRSAPAALAATLRQGRRLTMQLVEINLVLGIVKLALIVLAMVFSAIPLPFETVMTGNSLDAWYAFVGVLYLAASDFFQIARLASFFEFRRR